MRIARGPLSPSFAWSLVLAVLLLGPALAPGYVLSYDMVWVPHLALRPDFLGVGTALPRAVPSDAVVAVLDNAIPGMLLQKVVLLGSLVVAGTGAAALVPRLSVPARLAASTFYIWNPFVVERLVMGHWPLLLAYAVLPWLVVQARNARSGRRTPWLGLLVPLGSLSPSAGLVTAVALLSLEWRGRSRPRGEGPSRRRGWALVALVLAANAPWLMSGALHVSTATSSRVAAHVFALHREGSLPAPLAALGLGGIWNSQVVPVTRDGPLAIVALVVTVALALIGWRHWRHGDTAAHERAALGACWAIGWGWACLTWLLPGVSGWLAANVPGGGVMRDGARALALCAPLLACLVAHGVEALARRVAGRAARSALAVALGLAPAALMPDVAWAAGGAVAAVSFPSSYAAARVTVGSRGDVLVLPFTSYRAPSWNGHRPVLDPMGRYLEPDFVASDTLVVNGRALAGEDPRAATVTRALSADDPAARLAGLGIATVVTDAPGGREHVVAPVVFASEGVVVQSLAGVRPRRAAVRDAVVMSLAWTVFVGVPGGWLAAGRRWSSRPAARQVRR